MSTVGFSVLAARLYLSSDMRKLPTVDFEGSLEFVSVCALNQPDCGSAILALDSLQTFDAASAPGHWDAPEVHEFFVEQDELNEYVKCQLQEQRKPKTTSRLNIIQCSKWMLTLTATHQLLVRYEEGPGVIVTAPVTGACFDSDLPSFWGSNGDTYNLVGPPVDIAFPETNLDASKFKTDFATHLYPTLQQLTDSLIDNWCESHLARLLSVLDAHAVVDGTYFRTNEKLKGAAKIWRNDPDPVTFFNGKCLLMISCANSKKRVSREDACEDGTRTLRPTVATNSPAILSFDEFLQSPAGNRESIRKFLRLRSSQEGGPPRVQCRR